MLDNAKISVNMPKSGRMDFVLHVPTVIPCLLEHRCTSWDSGREGEQSVLTSDNGGEIWLKID